jgi:hypothetical protein
LKSKSDGRDELETTIRRTDQAARRRQARDAQDAADYIMGLPKKVHDAPHWQLAMEQLIDAAEGRNFIMHARIAVLKALNHGKPSPASEPRRKAFKKYRIVR